MKVFNPMTVTLTPLRNALTATEKGSFVSVRYSSLYSVDDCRSWRRCQTHHVGCRSRAEAFGWCSCSQTL